MSSLIGIPQAPQMTHLIRNKPTSFGLTEAQVNTLIAAYGEPFTTALLNQLNALPTSFAPTNAEQNVQSNWNTSGDAPTKQTYNHNNSTVRQTYRY